MGINNILNRQEITSKLSKIEIEFNNVIKEIEIEKFLKKICMFGNVKVNDDNFRIDGRQKVIIYGTPAKLSKLIKILNKLEYNKLNKLNIYYNIYETRSNLTNRQP